jgi:hypothetical protein
MLKDKIGILILLFLLTSIVMLPGAIVRGSPEEVLRETLLFENFEEYKAGSFPLSGGWIPLCFKLAPPTHVVVENSCMDYGTIVDISSTKVLRLWEGGAERLFSTDADIIGFEAYVMVESASGSWPRCVVGFVDRERTTYAGVVFTSSGKSNWVEGVSWWDHKIALSSFLPNKWYKVRLILDRSRDTFSVWVNDELRETNILTDKSRRVEAIELGASSGFRCYFDNVKVFTLVHVENPPPSSQPETQPTPSTQPQPASQPATQPAPATQPTPSAPTQSAPQSAPAETGGLLIGAMISIAIIILAIAILYSRRKV